MLLLELIFPKRVMDNLPYKSPMEVTNDTRYIHKVLKSCETKEQKVLVYKWVLNYLNINDKYLNDTQVGDIVTICLLDSLK